MLVPRTALAQHREQQPVCHGCGIPAGDVHMSTCKSGKWPSRVSDGDMAAPAPVAQHGEPVAWTHSCNALCTDGLELWIDHCPHCGKPRTAHAEQWPPGLITDIVLTVTALHKEVDIGWSPDARSHLSRLSTSIGMLAAAPAPQAQPVAQPLTDKRISWLWSESHNDTTDRMAFQVFARAIEAAHGIREVNER